MPEIRPAASLTSSLLARRGDARPAMRRQAITNLHMPLTPHDDLGWNDHGEELEQEAQQPLIPPAFDTVEQPQPASFDMPDDDDDEADHHYSASPLAPLTRSLEALASRITSVARDTTSMPMVMRIPDMLKRSDPASRKAAFTLRLDPARHLRLRLLSALTHRSSQQLLIEALDLLLAQNAKVEELAQQAEASGEGFADAATQ